MQNIYDYIAKYKNKTFDEKKFNEIDNVIFSMISYLNLHEVLSVSNDKTLLSISKAFFEKNKLKDISKFGMIYKDPYRVLKKVFDTKRFSKVVLRDYEYILDNSTQFCAMTFDVTSKLSYIAFRGTDHTLRGWFEDAEIACYYPVACHNHAINYLKKIIKLTGPNYIVGGHSKGGHLALVSSMYVGFLKQSKIKRIYNNDGPGLRRRQHLSYNYTLVRHKYIHIVPSNSIIGILMHNESKKYKVVRCAKKNIFSHFPIYWEVLDDEFDKGYLSVKSKRLERSIIKWLDSHSDAQKIQLVNKIYKMLLDIQIDEITDFMKFNYLLKLFKKSRTLDKDTKELLVEFLRFNYDSMQKGIDEL